MSKLLKWIVGFVIVLLIVAALAIGVLILLGPSTGRVFTNITSVSCVYRIKVVAFEDVNGDGVQNPGEAGIAGVSVSLQHSLQTGTSVPEQTLTNATGQAVLDHGGYCEIHDAMTIKAVLPSGYSATTPLSFGPYPVPEFTDDSKTQIAKQPIPAVIYVGLHRNS